MRPLKCLPPFNCTRPNIREATVIRRLNCFLTLLHLTQNRPLLRVSTTSFSLEFAHCVYYMAKIEVQEYLLNTMISEEYVII